MKCKFVLILFIIFIGGICLSTTAMAQGKGHTGGLGEARIPFNYASAVNLAKAPGITKDIAEAIVEYREENGPFMKAEDLLKVPGITEEVYKKITPQVGTEGDLYAVPRPGEELEEDDEDIPLAPSKC